MAIAAGLIILISWTPPASVNSMDSAVRSWNRITKPWRTFTDRMENAFTSLESPSGGRRGEFFGSELMLGRGFPLSDSLMFTVEVPSLPTDQRPPRYYWRGRTYDFYSEGQWFTTQSSLVDYVPSDIVPISFTSETPDPARFVFNTGDLTFSLVYTPSQTVWMSRQGTTRRQSAGDLDEIISWYAYPSLLAGEVYQVDAIPNNPNIEQLRQAGTDYPAWVVDQYLQMPADFSTKVSDLAAEITSEYDNPFDKTTAITGYLRENLEYSDSISLAPRNADPLEWMLFEYKKAYCVYYSSAEIMMLRSIGIPARLAVGFAQGERDGDSYIVHRNDAHAWPEVYFPNVGWVEFEPTGSQPALSRPLPPGDDENNGNASNLPDLAGLENDRDNFRGLQEEGDIAVPDQVEVAQPVNPSLYLFPILIILATLTIYFGRRYSVPARLPGMLRTTYERTGIQTPNWVVNWEQWVNTSHIQRSFESINFALGILKHPVTVDATPNERANILMDILQKASIYTQNLLDEHQTSLYTSRQADVQRARLAAFNIRKFALLEAIRYVFEGRPIQDS
jgi:transglutaminase-like putative cysteine protease